MTCVVASALRFDLDARGRYWAGSMACRLSATEGTEFVRLIPTIRHRTVRSKGCLSNKIALAMIFKLAEAAEKSWRGLDGHNQLPKVILGVKFTDGIEIVRAQAQAAAA